MKKRFGIMCCLAFIIASMNSASFSSVTSFVSAEESASLPTIVDETNTITKEQETQLQNQFAEAFPDTDLSRYTLSYSPEKSEFLTDYTRIGFDVYYDDIYIYDGSETGAMSADSIVCMGIYEGEDFTRVFSQEFYDRCQELDFSNLVTADEVSQMLENSNYLFPSETTLVIYNFLTFGTEAAKVAYKVQFPQRSEDAKQSFFLVDAKTNEILLKESNVDYVTTSFSYSSMYYELKCSVKNEEVTIEEINALQPIDLEIPSVINGYPVTAIAGNAYASSLMCLNSVTIPEGVTSIGARAFLSSNGVVKTVTLPKSIQSIGEYAIGYLDTGITKRVDQTTVIHGYAGTVAESYASRNQLGFKDLTQEGTTTTDTTTTTTLTETSTSTETTTTTSTTTAATTTAITTVSTTGTEETQLGDVNNDGSVTISDAVLLQKWLLSVPNTTLPNWKAADLCKDERLNVFDLCLLKQMLIEQ